jgi:long-chain acyl-CoA synthetase
MSAKDTQQNGVGSEGHHHSGHEHHHRPSAGLMDDGGIPLASVAPLDVTGLFEGLRLVVLGGTGFLGKVFWLMLLDRYPGVGKIYLLVRRTRELTSEERFWNVIVKNEAFSPLRDKYGDGFEAFVREKVVPIDGDVGRPFCGVSEDVLAAIAGTIDVVVNVAGVVDFNPPLDEALDANAFGSQNLLALTRRIGEGRLDAGPRTIKLMHTSTCYVAGRRKGPIAEVDPRTVPFPRAGELGSELWDPDREIAECLDIIREAKHRADDAFRQSEFAEKAKKNLAKRGEPTYGEALEAEVARVKRKYLDVRLIAAGKDRAVHWGWPNIYTYTKSIGEQVIAASGLPCTIVRPGCCEATLRFPFPGWNEGISTSAPHTYLIMKGHMTIPGTDDPIDLIPTDLVTAGMIMSLAELVEGTQKPVYQYGIADVNPASIIRLGELIGLYRRRHFQKKSKGNALLNLAQSRFEPVFVPPQQFEMSSSPAISKGAKGLAKMMRGVPALASMAASLEKLGDGEERIADLLRLFVPFTAAANGPFTAANTRAAYARLSGEDRTKLPWDPEKLEYADWMMNVQLPAFERWVMPEMDKKVNRATKPLRSHPTLVHLVDAMAERFGLSVAMGQLEADGFSRVTFADVKTRSIAAAGRLQAEGIRPGDTVVLMAANHPDWGITSFGIGRAGAAVVPVDPSMDAQGFARILGESRARAIVWDADSAKKHGAAAGARAVFNLHELTVAEGAPPVTPVDVQPNDIASVLFTSGTTGTPKGVKLTHANFTSLAAQLAPLFPLKPGDRVLSVLPLHHTFEFTCGLILPLSRGARVAYLDSFTGDRLARALELGKVTAMVGVPALWQLIERRIMARAKERGAVVEAAMNLGADFNRALGRTVGVDVGKLLFGQVHDALGGNVKYLISGGAALPKETQKRFAGWGLPLFEGYGLTEAAPVLTVTEKGKGKAGVVGRPIPGVELKIHEPDANGIGEVFARGPNVMAGYTDVEATARTLGADGWLHTGDLGKLDDKGRLALAGRRDDVIIGAGGENIHPDDLEALIGDVPHVSELAIVGVTVDGSKRIACLAVPEAGDDDRATRNERARDELRLAFSRLPYGKQPAIVHLYDAKLPRTATRKVKRPEVAEILGRLIVATTKAPLDGQTNPVRMAISVVRHRPVDTIASGATLLGDLSFDSLALSELLVVLEARYGTIDPDALQACSTVADVEALVGLTRESLPPPPVRATVVSAARARIESGEDWEDLVLPVPLQEAGKRFIGKLQDAFYGQLMSARVYGRAFIPQNRNTIVVANHASHLDMGFVRHALGAYGEDIVSLAAQDYFFDKSPIRRAFFENFTNLQAIDRSKGLRASERQAAEILKQGKTMLIFPEGTRSPDGDVHEFKSLVGHLSLTYRVDILPVYMSGTREAMPKGARLPTRRDLTARIGLPLTVTEMRRLTQGMTPADASREASRLAYEAILALRAGDVLDLTTLSHPKAKAAAASTSEPSSDEAPRGLPALKKKDHPLVTLFTELGTKFKPGTTTKPISFYFTLGGDPQAKWTVRVDAERCDIKPGKPEGDQADCVLKTSPEIFEKIVREAYLPGPAEFLSGAVKSNDVELLLTFQKVFELG